MMFGNKHWRVKLRGRSGVIYEEAGRTLSIDAEMLFGETDLVIYFENSSRWDAPYEHEPISIKEKNRIKANITTSLEKKGLKVEWDDR